MSFKNSLLLKQGVTVALHVVFFSVRFSTEQTITQRFFRPLLLSGQNGSATHCICTVADPPKPKVVAST